MLGILAAGLHAQSLLVLPVTLQLAAGQRAASLAITNESGTETTIQVRVFAWKQQNGEDQLTATPAVLVSPPMVTIAPRTRQVIRLVLRPGAQDGTQGREQSFRILLDQMPPPAVPGVVQIVFRLSIPVFAEPARATPPHLRFHLEREGGQLYLVAVNDGERHEVVRDITVATLGGLRLKAEPLGSQYLLAGSSKRWAVAKADLLRDSLMISGHADSGVIAQQAAFVAVP